MTDKKFIGKTTLDEILDALPEEGRDELLSLLQSQQKNMATTTINNFIRKYDDDCSVDQIIGQIMADVINRVGHAIVDNAKPINATEKAISHADALLVAASELIKIANNINKYANRAHSGECKH